MLLRSPMLDAFRDVAPGKQRGGEADEGDEQQDQRAQSVARQPLAREPSTLAGARGFCIATVDGEARERSRRQRA